MMRTLATAVLMCFSPLVAYSQMISVSPARPVVADEIVVAATGMTCTAGQTDVLLDELAIPASPAKDTTTWVARLPATLRNKHYSVRLRCGPSSSQPVGLDVVPAVICATNLTPKPTEEEPKDSQCSQKNVWELRMGDRVSLTVKNLDQFFGASSGKPLHLVLGDVELKNLEMQRGTPGTDGTETLATLLEFDNTPENRKAWVQVLQTARDNKSLSVSIGQDGMTPLATTATIHLNLYPVTYTTFAVVVVLALFLSLFLLGRRSNLLRDSNGLGASAPFSLAKHQMAVWFVVVVSALLFVSVLTGTTAATSPTAVILIGISGATGLAAITIDKAKQAQVGNTAEALKAEQAALTQALNDPAGLKAQLAGAVAGSPEALQLTAAIQTKTLRLAEIATELGKPQAEPARTRQWILDLVSDEDGVSFHRLQMLAWTVVLVGVFIRGVWRDFAMPDFDATTLGLMGISSGTYIGFKFPEQK